MDKEIKVLKNDNLVITILYNGAIYELYNYQYPKSLLPNNVDFMRYLMEIISDNADFYLPTYIEYNNKKYYIELHSNKETIIKCSDKLINIYAADDNIYYRSINGLLFFYDEYYDQLSLVFVPPANNIKTLNWSNKFRYIVDSKYAINNAKNIKYIKYRHKQITKIDGKWKIK